MSMTPISSVSKTQAAIQIGSAGCAAMTSNAVRMPADMNARNPTQPSTLAT